MGWSVSWLRLHIKTLCHSVVCFLGDGYFWPLACLPLLDRRRRQCGCSQRSFVRWGCSLFWCGIQDIEAKERIERAYLPAPRSVRELLLDVRVEERYASPRLISRLRHHSCPDILTTEAPCIHRCTSLHRLTGLLLGHPLDLTHVSSRQLAGSVLDLDTKLRVRYSDLFAADVQWMEEVGMVDASVLALPNGTAKPFVNARTAARRGVRAGRVALSLSAT
ncbi:hypothetical protein DFH11DRAFT_952379 [Phellopilus nigrolimitatus]|nr:hypothetical protein DFH11DRAFT_952379 [Phellopilus nigrolimitatus]